MFGIAFLLENLSDSFYFSGVGFFVDVSDQSLSVGFNFFSELFDFSLNVSGLVLKIDFLVGDAAKVVFEVVLVGLGVDGVV